MMKVTVLGCGPSAGVPALKYGWGDCDENNSKNKRTRSSIVLEKSNTSVLIDMSPDLRQQLLDYGNSNFDAVIFTHSHYDHVNGINELRSVFFEQERLLPIYAAQDDMNNIKKSFFYLFEGNGVEIYKPYIEPHVMEGTFTIGDISGICFEQDHGFSKSRGIRVNNFAYSTDVVSLSDESFEILNGIDTWIVDCLSLKSVKSTHAHLDLVLEWVKKINPKRTFLTHMDTTMDYNTLLKILPENIKPAYDQMTILV
ncbi:MAG: MBL fold metallo-hydrolase [Holosporaceae bacterium]|jgi:phosphoribosyl 1,2-cyclic phosphate phosphodiesterase|nr:MBL fold metallo-hydrolase [Holosporaceae bacterium]